MTKRTDEIIPIDEARARKKKKQPQKADNKALDRQVENGDTMTIADAKQFIIDAKAGSREDFVMIAKRSWNEVERRNNNDGKLVGVNNVTRNNRWARFPLWWSCLKIRQPITLARLPIPTLKDTQGDDPYGRTACVIGERFTRSILKTFDALPEFASAVDDFLVTNFGWGRPFYKVETYEEPEKVRLQVVQQSQQAREMQQMQPTQGDATIGQSGSEPPSMQEMPPLFLTPDRQRIDESQVLTDEFGPYMLTGGETIVENEEIYWEAQTYDNLFTEPGVRRWNKITRIGIGYPYTYREFKEKFGQDAIDKLSIGDLQEHKDGKKPIMTYELYDSVLKECRWFAETTNDFIQPLAMQDNPEDLEEVKEGYDNSDIYGLSNFFPCTEPLLINQSTKYFWPTPEYFQISDIIDDINSIVGRMVQLTKAIRVRFFFDSSFTELKKLIGENWSVSEGDGLGIPNLQQTLMNNKGDLSALVAFFPVDVLIDGLKNIYEAYTQRLDMFYQVTGISDLIRGQTNPDSDKTYGERQMEGKFAMNRMEPLQTKVQEWIKNQFELMMEMGLKMFSDKTIDEYVTPQTLEDEDKQRYIAALELLKANKRRRFRVDFETDSTIAINQDWRKQNAIEAANIISKMVESVANVAQTQPELAGVELQLTEHVVSELTDGKLIFDKVKDSIQQVIERVAQPKPEQPDPATMKAQNDAARLQFDEQKQMTQDKLEDIKVQSNERIEMAKLQQQAMRDSITSQLKQLELGLQTGKDHADLQQAVTKLQADIAQGWEDLNIKKENMLLIAQKEGGKANVEAFKAQIDARVRDQEITLEQASLALQAHEAAIGAADFHASLQERIATEQRLQAEHQINVESQKIDSATKLLDAIKPEAPKAPPISVDLSKTVHIKPPAPMKAKAKSSKEKKNEKRK